MMLVAMLLASGCTALDHGILNAQGPVATHERHFLLIVSGILLFTAVPVLILTPLVAWHYRLSNSGNAYRPKWDFSWPLEGLIWIPPVGIVILLGFLLWPATQKDDPYTRLAERGAPLRVQAIGLDWKWVFIYPDEGVATVNQLAVPVGRPVQIQLTSGTVMQSMLMPQLAGQLYAMAGMTTKLNFAADRPGVYLGENTQFNGLDFAKEKFDVIALDQGGYRGWLARVHQAAHPLDSASWAALSRKEATTTAFFSSVPPGFFAHVVAATGGMSPSHRHGGAVR